MSYEKSQAANKVCNFTWEKSCQAAGIFQHKYQIKDLASCIAEESEACKFSKPVRFGRRMLATLNSWQLKGCKGSASVISTV